MLFMFPIFPPLILRNKNLLSTIKFLAPTKSSDKFRKNIRITQISQLLIINKSIKKKELTRFMEMKMSRNFKEILN